MKTNTTIKVQKRVEPCIESITDHNEGHPNQKNRGRFYRYEVTFINGETYESNSKSDILNYFSHLSIDEINDLKKPNESETENVPHETTIKYAEQGKI